MARVTVEDCVLRVPNRFELVKLAGQRAREISAGAQLTIARDNDKNPVVALREIADDTVDLEGLREGLVKGFQRVIDYEDSEEDIVELMAGEEEWLSRALGQSAAAAEEGSQEVSREELLREAEKLFEDAPEAEAEEE